MAITYYMLQIEPYIFFMLIVLSGALLAGISTWAFRRFSTLKILKSHNEVTGFLFLSIASFYALLLSFVVLVVWDQLNEVHSNVSKEGNSALGLYRDIRFYPDSAESKELMTVYLDFVYNVIDDEFPKMEQMKQSRKTTESFSAVFYKLERMNPQNPMHIEFVSRMFNHLNELSVYRGLRTGSLDSEIPSAMWLPLIFGAILTVACAILLDIEHKSMHIGLTAMLGGLIGMFLFTIILLDHPYTGTLRIKPKQYEQIFTIDKWTNEFYNNQHNIKE